MTWSTEISSSKGLCKVKYLHLQQAKVPESDSRASLIPGKLSGHEKPCTSPNNGSFNRQMFFDLY